MTEEQYEELCDFLRGIHPQTARVEAVPDLDGPPQWTAGPMLKPTIWLSPEDYDDLWARVGGNFTQLEPADDV